ncbi:MAG TPA: hypothetical protein VFA81_10400 [Burkholderiales bacterium]|nr:hypothetical protein [Burkholderiales bacterium]
MGGTRFVTALALMQFCGVSSAAETWEHFLNRDLDYKDARTAFLRACPKAEEQFKRGQKISATCDRLWHKILVIESEVGQRYRVSLPDVQLGMTPLQVANETNWGPPNQRSHTTTLYGTREYWSYHDGRSLYFDNGRLISITR